MFYLLHKYIYCRIHLSTSYIFSHFLCHVSTKSTLQTVLYHPVYPLLCHLIYTSFDLCSIYSVVCKCCNIDKHMESRIYHHSFIGRSNPPSPSLCLFQCIFCLYSHFKRRRDGEALMTLIKSIHQ